MRETIQICTGTTKDFLLLTEFPLLTTEVMSQIYLFIKVTSQYEEASVDLK